MIYKERLETLLESLPTGDVEVLFRQALARTEDNYENYWIDTEVGARKVLWDRLCAPQDEKAHEMSLVEALTLAHQASVLAKVAYDLLHQIATGRIYVISQGTPPPEFLTKRIMDVAADCERSLRHASAAITYNHMGLIDVIQREINEQGD